MVVAELFRPHYAIRSEGRDAHASELFVPRRRARRTPRVRATTPRSDNATRDNTQTNTQLDENPRLVYTVKVRRGGRSGAAKNWGRVGQGARALDRDSRWSDLKKEFMAS